MWVGNIPFIISRKMKTSWVKHKTCFQRKFEGHNNRKWLNGSMVYCLTETCKVYFFSCSRLGVQELRDYNCVIVIKILCFSIYALSREIWTLTLLLPIFKLSVSTRSHQFTSSPLKFSCPIYSSMHWPLKTPKLCLSWALYYMWPQITNALI